MLREVGLHRLVYLRQHRRGRVVIQVNPVHRSHFTPSQASDSLGFTAIPAPTTLQEGVLHGRLIAILSMKMIPGLGKRQDGEQHHEGQTHRDQGQVGSFAVAGCTQYRAEECDR